MATIPRFEINGVIDTSKPVLNNLTNLCNSCGCWMTYDVNSGMWSVTINKPSASVKSFNDSNIIGSINISCTGISELYNAVSVEFPHKDLKDQTDFIDYEIPINERFPNELDNTLSMSLSYINDPVQAAFIGQVELKQARVDKVIEFRTDYSAIGLKAGEVIDITSTMYGFDKKLFRITKLSEADTDDGSIQISITALEYDDNIYLDTGLIRTERSKKTGIVPKSMNTALTAADAASQANTLTIGLDAASQEYLDALAEKLSQKAGLQVLVTTGISKYIQAEPQSVAPTKWHTLATYTSPYSGIFKYSLNLNWGGYVISTESRSFKSSYMRVLVNGAPADTRGGDNTGDYNVPLFEDHSIDQFFLAQKGQTITLQAAVMSGLANTEWQPIALPTYQVMLVPPRASFEEDA